MIYISFWTDITLHLEQQREEFFTLNLCQSFFPKRIYFIVNFVVAQSTEFFIMLKVIAVEILLVVLIAKVFVGFTDNLVFWRQFLFLQ